MCARTFRSALSFFFTLSSYYMLLEAASVKQSDSSTVVPTVGYFTSMNLVSRPICRVIIGGGGGCDGLLRAPQKSFVWLSCRGGGPAGVSNL